LPISSLPVVPPTSVHPFLDVAHRELQVQRDVRLSSELF
jgi:hypothetical protein